MRKKLYCCTVTILFLLIGCRSSLQERVLSPDGRIEVVLNNPDGGNLSYSVNVEGESFIRDSRLGFVFKDSLISGPFRTEIIITRCLFVWRTKKMCLW